MKELIERLRNATGPDRSVDHTLGAWMGFEGFPADCPRYTASIDAALTLVPNEDHHWKCGYSKHVRHNAEVRDLMHPHKGTFVGEHDQSRAIALVIAALLAIEATDRTPPIGSAPKDSGGQR